MEKKVLKEPSFVQELLELVRAGLPDKELVGRLSGYHENDIADALAQLSEKERRTLYRLLGKERLSEIFTYLEDVEVYLKELPAQTAADIISCMDSDDAVDVLEEMDDADQEKIVSLLDDEAEKDVRLILSYDEDEIGSYMTTNYVVVGSWLTIRQAMHELVRQAGENDNISTIYVVDEKDIFYGAIDLKDLIIAREYQDLGSLVSTSYPYATDHEKIVE